MSRKLMLAAGAIAAAVIAIWFLRRGGDTPAPPPAPAGRAAQATRPGDATEPAARDRGEAPMRFVIDDDPVGALRLEGQVIDAGDQPVGGATVVLAANPPRTVTTEADGSFAFDQLVGRPYTLIARAPAGVAGPVTARLTASSEPVVLKLRAGAKLEVTVVGKDGQPLDATVELRGVDEQRAAARGGAATFAPVAPGGYQIAAWADGMARAFQWIQIGAADATAKLTLVAGAPVLGRVVDERGAGVGGVRVRYGGASDWSQQSSDRLDAAITAADGAFRFDALPAGTMRFTATHPDHAPGTSPLVTLDGKTTATVTITLGAGAVVRGKVVDAGKRPVPSARVRIGAAGAQLVVFERPRQAYTDAAGEFEIKGLPRRELAAVALHETGASGTVAVDTSGGSVSDVVLAIDVTGTIAGVVVDPDGTPLEGVQVSAGPSFADNRTPTDFADWRLRGFPEELTDSAGKFTLTGLAPGSYNVTAVPAASASRGRRGASQGVTAATGETGLRIVLPPEGGVKGKVAFADGKAPALFTVSVALASQTFSGGSGEFELDALPPQQHELLVRGPAFETRALAVTVESGKTADVGTVVVAKGRAIAGVVIADGRPVAGATVFAGRMVFGSGSTSTTQGFNPMGQGTKTDTTDAAGAFQLTGFGEGDITLVAEHEAIGRSRALRLPTVVPGQTELTLALEPYGSLAGMLRQGGKPAEGVRVSCQSVSSPGALYGVAAGPDGAFRFDRLAPDVYRVSATVGMPMTGMKFYARQVEVRPGQQATVELAVEPGAVVVELVPVPRNGALGVAQAFLSSGVVSARTANELALALAAAGPGASQFTVIRSGEPARFSEVSPGSYSVCAVPYPAEVKGMAAMSYGERHADSLLAFCKPIVVAAAPPTQTVQLSVELPPFVPDEPPPAPPSN